MKFLEEYRDPAQARRMVEAIRALVTRPHTIMEVCGGQTHSIVRHGIDTLLPREVTLIHGPGCPVCVTPVQLIDQAIAVAKLPEVIFCSFGDMLRVPGSREDLLNARAHGADVRMVYSPLDALRIAAANPAREVVFFGVGFETTAPANALAVYEAHMRDMLNFSLLSAHVRVPPALEALLRAPNCRVQGFLAAGHVCTIMGCTEYEQIAAEFHVPIVVTGFEPLDILQGIYYCILQLESGRAEVENRYARAVQQEGNQTARELMERVFQVTDRPWRGLGEIPRSGLELKAPYDAYDALRRFQILDTPAAESPECISGEILQGLKLPAECAAFGTRCTPEHPLGAPMVSGEGACAAYYRYRRQESAPREKASHG